MNMILKKVITLIVCSGVLIFWVMCAVNKLKYKNVGAVVNFWNNNNYKWNKHSVKEMASKLFHNVSIATNSLDNYCEQFIVYSNFISNFGRLGNQISIFVAVLSASEISGRSMAINSEVTKQPEIEKVFKFKIDHLNGSCQKSKFAENPNKSLAYDENIESLQQDNILEKFQNKTIILYGYFQSWKYIRNENVVRSHLQFKDDIKEFAETFIESNISPDWKNIPFTRVGIHARRGDILTRYSINYGFTCPGVEYFKKAMKHMIDKFGNVHFYVASDDMKWARSFITADLVDIGNRTDILVKVTHVGKHTPGQDMAILSLCQHTIMSTGTFGWWAAWLANGTTTYYNNWPRNGSSLAKRFIHSDYFPEAWIGIT